MKVIIIANPTSGRGRSFRRVESLLRNWPFAGWEVELIPTRGRGHAGEIATQLCSRPPDVLAVCGGDGTMNEVAAAVPDPPFPVALLPAGTANVLARELSLPMSLLGALRIALDRKVHRVDLGLLKTQAAHRFLLMAGVGFDAHVVAATKLGSKRRLGIVAYYFSTVQSLIAYPFPEFHVVAEGETIPAISCIVANARGYGGGLVLTPEADMSNGRLDILILQAGSKSGLLRFLISARLGRPGSFAFVRRVRTTSLAIEGSSAVPVQVDGEPAGFIPARIQVSHAAFPLVVPAAIPSAI